MNAVNRDKSLDSGTASVMTSVTELRISESDLASAVEKEREGPAEKKRTLEEIVGQLLMQNREFQRILKKQRHFSCRRRMAETSDEEDDYRSHKHNRLVILFQLYDFVLFQNCKFKLFVDEQHC